MTAVARIDFLGGARGTRLSSSLAAGANSLSVDAGGLSTWTGVTHGRIPVIINHGEADEERLYATAVAGDSLTGLVRGQDGTADQPHSTGATVTTGLFADHLDKPNAFLSSPTAAGQVAVSDAADSWGTPTSTLSGLTLPNASLADATLTNPTMTSPNIGGTEWGDAQHTHSGPSQGGILGGGAPAASAPGDTSSTGTAGAYATANHRHARESFRGTANPSQPGDVGSGGSADTVSRGDHVHGRELYATAITDTEPGDSASAGVANTVARGDHAHGFPAAILPVSGATLDFLMDTDPFTLSAAVSVVVPVTFSPAFSTIPVVTYGVQQNSSIRVAVEITALSASGVTFLVFRPDGSATTASGTIHWHAIAAQI